MPIPGLRPCSLRSHVLTPGYTRKAAPPLQELQAKLPLVGLDTWTDTCVVQRAGPGGRRWVLVHAHSSTISKFARPGRAGTLLRRSAQEPHFVTAASVRCSSLTIGLTLLDKRNAHRRFRPHQISSVRLPTIQRRVWDEQVRGVVPARSAAISVELADVPMAFRPLVDLRGEIVHRITVWLSHGRILHRTGSSR